MIFLACAFTAAVETALFALLGYRRAWQLTVVACSEYRLKSAAQSHRGARVFPAVSAHGSGRWRPRSSPRNTRCMPPAFAPGLRLFALTLAANALSYGLGLLLF